MANRLRSKQPGDNVEGFSLNWSTLMFCFALMVAIGSAIYAAYCAGYLRARIYVSELDTEVTGSGGWMFQERFVAMHIGVALCYVVICIGLWRRKLLGYLFSLLALLGLGAGYLWWYYESMAYLRNVELADFPVHISHVWKFRDAVWWDMIVLGVSIFLFIFIAINLVKMLYALSSQGIERTGGQSG